MISHSEAHTLELGRQLAQTLEKGAILCLWGDLGAGKTHFAKGLIHGRAGVDPQEVTSPTFVYLNLYGSNVEVAHFDLYRMRDEEDFLGMGFEEYFHTSDLVIIEWPERIAALLPPHSQHLDFQRLGETERSILPKKLSFVV